MLKRMLKKKLVIISAVMFAIGLLYFFPHNQDNYEIVQETEYYDSSLEELRVFLLDKNNYLALETVKTDDRATSIESKARQILEFITIGGTKENSIPSGFRPIIPQDTEILSLEYNEGVIKVDFSKELMDTSKDMEIKIIEAIVYNLTSIENVNYVIIFMNGNLLTKLPQSNITLPSTFDRSFGINKEFDVTNIHDITQTTVYYISKYNDDIYYVPVTKINNDNREKINIIIEELTSSNLYKTNLMSYLNGNTKLLQVNELENEFDLQFNEAIFNDIDKEDILEEVLYTISLSIMDNYNLESAVIKINNQEICKSVVNTIE